jgi:Domain of unknown function (DUF4159)
MTWLLQRKHSPALVLVGLCVVAAAAAQRDRFTPRLPSNPPYDGAFRFCRVMFRQNPNGDGHGWSVDYPRADVNLTYRLSELTSTIVSKDAEGHYSHVVLRLTDSELYRCPFIMITEPGGAYLDAAEAAALRDYLLKGGFLWADDFWGELAWLAWEGEIRKALPAGEYPIVDLPLGHPLFHTLYQVNAVPHYSLDRLLVGYGRSDLRARSRQRDPARQSHLGRVRQRHGVNDSQHGFRRCVRAGER